MSTRGDVKILMVGDLVGSPGRRALAQVVTRMRAAGKVDFVVANAENAAGGKGLTGPIAQELFAAGVNVVLNGNSVRWKNRRRRFWLQFAGCCGQRNGQHNG